MASHGAAKDGMRKGAKTIDHLRVRMAENGGHVVEHHFTSMEHQPEQHVFGAGQHKEMLAHVAQHMNVEAEPESSDLGKAEGSDKAEIDA